MESTIQVDQIDFFKRDGNTTPHFLHRFFPEKPANSESSTNVKELNLSLSLSMGGFYSQNAEEMPLTRSSTIPGEITLVAHNGVHWNSSAALDRSSSLPVEAERTLVRFGDLQTMRRAETGRRWLQERLKRAAEAAAAKKFAAAVTASKVPASNASVNLMVMANPSVDSSKHEGGIVNNSCGMPYTGPRGLAEVGANSNIHTSSNKGKGIMFCPKPITTVLPPRPANTRQENPPKRPKLRPLEPCGLRYEDLAVLSRMPTVTTTGDGPGGKRIQGFLYTYRGGQVSIVCVCHGNFLTPEGFVRHAGGKDVANPMKHITVCPNPF
ncbi:ninja-family protein AFP3-like [Prosopis cineraria]|uniref:ninja-family protein AFP3-like n=1 Tax=Prosopis cineraria TaxID=364024 RepID=UPI00241060F1|nr:ninja-family protein AFP3-like [Prosopis cineraria]XP_054820411.1 ninja-family protein AFP3-like [Prosopis cineraria]